MSAFRRGYSGVEIQKRNLGRIFPMVDSIVISGDGYGKGDEGVRVPEAVSTMSRLHSLVVH